jgi:hypothetical protein
MATEMVWDLRSSPAAGEYSSAVTWESEARCDLTAATTLVFAHGGITGNVNSGDTVTGQTSSATGVVTGDATSTQILLTGITGGPFEAGGEEMRVTAGNSVTSTGPGDSARAVLECYDDWPSGLDNKPEITSNWTTSATNYVVMRAPAGERHTGTPGSGFHFKRSETFSWIVRNSVPFTRLEFLEIQNTGNNANAQALNLNAQDDVTVFGCILSAAGTAATFGTVNRNNIRCNIIHEMSGASGPVTGLNIGSFSVDCNIENNVVSGFATGISIGASSSGISASNNVVVGATTSYSGTFNSGDTNAADDATPNTPPGTSPITTNVVEADDFNNAASDDYTLKTGSLLVDAGTNLSGSFDTDAVGVTPWPGTWDVGAFSFTTPPDVDPLVLYTTPGLSVTNP